MGGTPNRKRKSTENQKGARTPARPTWQSIRVNVEGYEFREALKLVPVVYANWWLSLVREDPWHVVVETMLVFFIVYLVFFKKQKKARSELTEDLVDQLIAEWEPVPLVPQLTSLEQKMLDAVVVVDAMSASDATITLKGTGNRLLINLANCDFLGMSGRKEVVEASAKTLDEYGCGSCGPRGFYGSVMPHIYVEDAMARFMGTKAAISYSDTASTQSSCVPAFAKRGDLLVVDAGIQEAIRTGVELSRAKVIFFRHNDAAHCREVLEKVRSDDRRLGRDPTEQRRFVVSEAIFRDDGAAAPLPELVALKKEFGFRLIVDESLSFGTVGATGRGLVEAAGVAVSDVDVITITLESTLASVGGICVGSVEVVDHQRLSGAGYCFSASAPPFVSSAAVAALKVLEREPELVESLQNNIAVSATFEEGKERGGLGGGGCRVGYGTEQCCQVRGFGWQFTPCRSCMETAGCA